MNLGTRRLERGGVSVLILVALIPLLLAVAALLLTSVRQHEEFGQEVSKSVAMANAFSGAQDALDRLEHARALNQQYDMTVNGGCAHVVGSPWKADGIDNDGNGLIDDPDEENLYSIRADGWLNALPDGTVEPGVQAFHAAADVVAEVVDFDFSFAQSIYIDDPAATVDINGGSFELSGYDVNLDRTKGPENSRPAVGINGDPAHIISQIANNQKAKIIGSLPDPAIGSTGPLTYDDYVSMLDPFVSIEWTAPSTSVSGSIGDLQNRVGAVAHCTGDLKVHGTTTGAGVLLVDGDLQLDGKFTYAGVIIVKGNVSFQGGGGVKELYGAMLIWGEDPHGPPKEDLEINGTVQIAYSSEGLALASATGGVRVLMWHEQ